MSSFQSACVDSWSTQFQGYHLPLSAGGGNKIATRKLALDESYENFENGDFGDLPSTAHNKSRPSPYSRTPFQANNNPPVTPRTAMKSDPLGGQIPLGLPPLAFAAASPTVQQQARALKRDADSSFGKNLDFLKIQDDIDNRGFAEKTAQLTPRRVGPRFDDSAHASVAATPRVESLNVQKRTKLQRSEVLYLTQQILVCHFETQEQSKLSLQRAAQQSATSVWASGRPVRGTPEIIANDEKVLSVGREVCGFLERDHHDKHVVVLSHHALMAAGWTCPIDMVDANPYEPPQLSYSFELVNRLVEYMRSNPSHVVMFVGLNINIMCQVLGIMLKNHESSSSVVALHRHICELTGERPPLAGSLRHLAMLHDIVKKPKILTAEKSSMVVGSLKLYGDHEFVRSTEALIRVHVEMHHSGVIDSTDFREQMHCRVTRGDDTQACLVLHFLAVELRDDVRAIVYSTLAGEMGLITGPQPMFQVRLFHVCVCCVCMCM